MSPGKPPPNFDRLARAYRWMEYLSLGPLLQRTRTRFLPELAGIRRALLLGDGDGRFAEALLRAHPGVHVQAVDGSAAMLATLRRRCPGPTVVTVQADLREFVPHGGVDLVTTHFVLDCLTQEEVGALLARVAPSLPSGALWAVSEFRVPNGPLHWPAWAYVRLLYLAFRLLTGLRVHTLPDHEMELKRAGLVLRRERRSLGGLLTAQLWQKA